MQVHELLFASCASPAGAQKALWAAGLNAIPLLAVYRADPDDEHLLRVGLGAITGGLANIHTDGSASMAFHSDPALLRHDPYRCAAPSELRPLLGWVLEGLRAACSGDYGIGLYGHLSLAASYLVWSGQGWLCYLCNLAPAPAPASGSSSAAWVVFGTESRTTLLQLVLAWLGLASSSQLPAVRMQPADAVHKRTYIELLGVYVSVQGGTISSLSFNGQLWRLSLRRYAAGPGFSPQLAVRWEHCAASRPSGSHFRVLHSQGVRQVSQVHRDCTGQ